MPVFEELTIVQYIPTYSDYIGSCPPVGMITFTDEKIGEGKGSIALQIHSGGGIKVRWRNINIKTL